MNKGKKGHEVTENEIIALNWMRESKQGRTFTRQEIKDIFKKIHFPICDAFLMSITNGANPPIIKIDKGKYQFAPTPIHIDRLKTVWDDYNKYNMSHKTKKSIKSDIDTITELKANQELDEQSCINYLKSLGYKIYRPKLEYEEI